LKLLYDELLSNFACNFNLRHYDRAQLRGSAERKRYVAEKLRSAGVNVPAFA